MSKATVSPHKDRALTEKGLATQSRIVEAASQLIFESGVNATSLDRIVSEARVHKSQLYHYFEDKSDLIQAVIDHQSDAILAAQEPYLSHLDTWEDWKAWRDLLVNIQLERACNGGCPIGSLVAELAETDERARTRIEDGFERWENAFRIGLTGMKEKGLLQKSADVDALALSMLVAVQGGLLLTQARKNVLPLQTALDSALSNLKSFSTTK
jgi:AcrR family transcriptional regulator